MGLPRFPLSYSGTDPSLSPEPEVSGAQMTVWLPGAESMTKGHVFFTFIFVRINWFSHTDLELCIYSLLLHHISIFPASFLPIWLSEKCVSLSLWSKWLAHTFQIPSTLQILTPQRFVCSSKDGRMAFLPACNKYQCQGPCLTLCLTVSRNHNP